MTIEAMKQALEALVGYELVYGSDEKDREAITSLRQAIEQAEKQEPVAWIDSDWHYQLHKKGMVVAHKNKSDVLIGNPQPFYTVPQPSPQTWVAITEEEFEQMLVDARFTKTDLMMIGACVDDIRQMIEAKLKEKNT